MHERELRNLGEAFIDGRIGRREFLRRATALTGSAALAAVLLAACGGGTAPAPSSASSTAGTASTSAASSAASPASSAASSAAGAPRRGGTLRVGLFVDAVTMDPHLSGSKIDRQIYNNVFDKLVDIDTKLNVVPMLAEKWDISADGLTYTFTLRKGVKFHDGSDFNAQAAKFNFDRMLDPDTKSLRKGEIASIKSAEAVDDSTLKLTLTKPDSPLLVNLTDRAGMMLSPDAVKKYGKDLATKAVGTGPFELVEFVKADHIALKRFEGYWQKGQPYLDGVRYRPILDDTVKLNSLKAEEIDVMDYVAPRDVAGLKQDKSLVVVDVPSLASFSFQFNTTKPPFDNKALRQAVQYGLDITQIVQKVWLGVGVPANGPIPPSSWAYDSSIKPIARDVEKAKAKLAEGGKPSGFTFTFTTDNFPLAVQEAQVMKAQLAEVGITLNINQTETSKLIADGNARNFEMINSEWSGRPDPDGNIYQFFHTGVPFNWSGYSNPKADQLMEKAREVSDRAERKRLYSELITILQEDAPYVFFIHPIEPKGFSPKVQGYDPVPDGMMRFKSVWLKA